MSTATCGSCCSSAFLPRLKTLVRLGLAHEEQHQELLLMDVLHLFSQSPIKPTYDVDWPVDAIGRRVRFKGMSGGPFELGATAASFAFDNERPRHTTWLQPFEISDRLSPTANGLLSWRRAGTHAQSFGCPTAGLSSSWNRGTHHFIGCKRLTAGAR